MENTSTYLVVCPHCGSTKRIAFSNIRWNKVNYTFWSDSRIESTEWCEPAWTQLCPSCNRFFTLPPKSSLKIENVPCEDTGALSYQTLKQAIAELSGEMPAEPNARLEAWWAYNRQYAGMTEAEIPNEEKDFNRFNMEWLVDYLSKETQVSYSLLFELQRLLGNIDEYKKLLDSLTFERFCEWRKERSQTEGLPKLDGEQIRHRYEQFIEEKKKALDKPLKPYKQ